ncbi:MAG: class I SAM-dependent methyltransferase, partial [Mycobacteriales bacterium]
MAEFVSHFAGTASYCAKHRPSYPPEVWDLLSDHAALTTASSMLDLGCGTGFIALALAGRVRRVTGVDPDADMLGEADRAATACGSRNVKWVLGTAEEFEGEPGTYRLVTIGSAFHWLARPSVAENAHRLLDAGGVLAVLGNPTPLDDVRRRRGVGSAIAEVQDRWFGLPPADAHIELGRPEVVLRASVFRDATVTAVRSEQRWDIERLVGFLRSTSWRPDQRLGDRFGHFVDDLATAICRVEPAGKWVQHGEVEIILARRRSCGAPRRISAPIGATACPFARHLCPPGGAGRRSRRGGQGPGSRAP